MSYTAPRLNVTASAASLAEGSGEGFVDVTLTLDQGLAYATSQRWVIFPAGGSQYDTASIRGALSDLSVTEGTVSFAAGETSRVVRVGIVGDAVAEQNEAFTFLLPSLYDAAMSSGYYYDYPNYGYAPPSAYSASFTVLNDDAPEMRVAAGAVVEGAAGTTTTLPFTVTLAAPMNAPVTVGWRTLDGTATAGSDYLAASGTLTLTAGETSGTIPVTVPGDAAAENNETVRLEFSNPANAILAGGGDTLSAIGTIRTDDAPPLAGTQRLNTGPDGAQADAGATGFGVSAGATRLAFSSAAGNLVSGDGNGLADLFTRDLAAGGATVRTVTAGEALGEGWTAHLPTLPGGAPSFALSADGARLFYLGTRAGAYDVFVEEIGSGAVRRLGAEGVAADAVPAVSADGRLLAFASASGGLVAGDDAGSPDVFVRDLDGGAVSLVSRDANGAALGGGYRDLVFSPDGSKLAFTVAASGGGAAQVWVRDLATGTVTLASGTAGGLAGDGDSGLATFSPDGTKLAFGSAAANLSPLTAVLDALATQFWIKDLATGALTLASADANGRPATAAAPAALASLGRASFSADGTLLAFASDGGLAGGDADGRADVFVRDLATGAVRLLESGNGAAAGPVFLPDNSVTFLGAGTDLVAGDGNNAADLFRAALPPAAVATGLTFSAGDMSVAEFGSTSYASFTIRLDGVEGRFAPPASVRWSIGALPGGHGSADGHYGLATAGTDFVAASGTVYFGSSHPSTNYAINGDPYAFFLNYPPYADTRPATGDGYLNGSNTAATIRVAIPNDTFAEPDELFLFTLSDAAGATILDAQGIGIIRNDDAPRLTIAGRGGVAEGAAVGGGTLLFDVRLAGPTTQTVTVNWRTADGTAQAGSDYAGATGTLTFAPGETAKVIAVAVTGDAVAEAPETLRVELFSPASATFGEDASGTLAAAGTIRDEDANLSVAAVAADGAEGGAGTRPFSFAVTRTGDLSAAQSVDWTVAGAGTNPADAADFAGGLLPSGTVAFAPGETSRTITVGVAGDALVEPDEGFALTLSDPTGGATLGIATAAGVIRGDDAFTTPVRAETLVTGGAGVDAAAIDGGLRGAAVFTEGGLPSRVTVGESGPGYALRSVEVLDFADGRLVFDPADPAAQVARLFNAALARAPDQAGLNYYIAFLEGGRSLADIGTGFISSPEFGARFGTGLGDDAYVGRLYANVLGRGASGDELGYYHDLLVGGTTRAQVLANFSESPENRERTAGLLADGVWDLNENAAITARLYDTMFGRLPDLAGLRYYREQLDAGTQTPLGFVGNFIGSPEFQGLYGADPGNARIVELLYRNTLHRTASDGELAYYVTQLDAGTLGRAQLVLNFSESPEHVGLTAANVGGDVPGQFGIAFA